MTLSVTIQEVPIGDPQPTPRIEEFPFSCKCGHSWIGHVILEVDADVFLKHLRGVHCPECGGGLRKIYMGNQS